MGKVHEKVRTSPGRLGCVITLARILNGSCNSSGCVLRLCICIVGAASGPKTGVVLLEEVVSSNNGGGDGSASFRSAASFVSFTAFSNRVFWSSIERPSESSSQSSARKIDFRSGETHALLWGLGGATGFSLDEGVTVLSTISHIGVVRGVMLGLRRFTLGEELLKRMSPSSCLANFSVLSPSTVGAIHGCLTSFFSALAPACNRCWHPAAADVTTVWFARPLEPIRWSIFGCSIACKRFFIGPGRSLGMNRSPLRISSLSSSRQSPSNG
mmetsp:Transcript_6599/g.12413  ORF Transcript_6599/g.12413 Transcript_6599/m.12413 type:complete len:270 (+) Transcript_6599:569-1378(+)